MTDLLALWLPILVSAVVVFIASAVIHMAPLWHRNDYPAVPNEDRVMDALRPFAIPPGEYSVPRASGPKEMQSPEYVEKLKRGPVLVMTVLPNGPVSLSRSLVLWFVYTVVVSLLAAYVASRALPPGADYLRVFQIAGATAFIAYAMALWQLPIWAQRSWSLANKEAVDGLIYGLLTAGTFGWLWPDA